MKKITICILVVLFFLQFSNAQNFQVGHLSINLVDTSRSNRSIPVEIYYPADVAGDNVPLTSTQGQFPVVSFGHGFVMTWDAYANVWNALVPEGYILIFPKTEGSTSPSHPALGLDLSFCIDQMNLFDTDSASPFYNRVDTMNCVMGHSMGGGAAFLAAANNPSVKAIATLAAAETNPSAIQAALAITSPALVIAGGNDCITPPSTNQVPMYDSLASSCKAYISITGGSHCQMANNNFLCSFGELTCTPAPAISRALQHTILFRQLLPWLNYTLKNDCASRIVFDSLLINSTDITAQQFCQPCTTTGGLNPHQETMISVYPNPASENINFHFPATLQLPVTLTLCDPQGRIVKSLSANNASRMVVSDLSEGLYLLRINNMQTKRILIRR